MSTSSATWPPVRPVDEYDLSQDPIHKHAIPGRPVVFVPGIPTPFQHAFEAPPHMWPHNALPMGFVRHIPTATDTPLPRGLQVLACRLDGKLQGVFDAFAYTHPKIVCHSCRVSKRPCIHTDWTWPDMTRVPPQWPSMQGEELRTRQCWGCRTDKSSTCSNVNRSLRPPHRKVVPAVQGDYEQYRRKRGWRVAHAHLKSYVNENRLAQLSQGADPGTSSMRTSQAADDIPRMERNEAGHSNRSTASTSHADFSSSTPAVTPTSSPDSSHTDPPDAEWDFAKAVRVLSETHQALLSQNATLKTTQETSEAQAQASVADLEQARARIEELAKKKAALETQLDAIKTRRDLEEVAEQDSRVKELESQVQMYKARAEKLAETLHIKSMERIDEERAQKRKSEEDNDEWKRKVVRLEIKITELESDLVSRG